MIAISYRRQDSLPIAGRLYDRLQGEFGKGNVFMDFDSIPYGVDFRQHIKDMLDRSKILLALIGPDWSGRSRQKKRRIDDPSDFVRLEIAYAFERKIPVIPVLIGNTPMPKAENLPADIADLAFRNAIALDVGVDFHHHADRLVRGINGLLIEAARSSTAPVMIKPPPAKSQENAPTPVHPVHKPAEPRETLFQESELLGNELIRKTSHAAKAPPARPKGPSVLPVTHGQDIERGAGIPKPPPRPFTLGPGKNFIRVSAFIALALIVGTASYLIIRTLNKSEVAAARLVPAEKSPAPQASVGNSAITGPVGQAAAPLPQAVASGSATAPPIATDEANLARSKFAEAKRSSEAPAEAEPSPPPVEEHRISAADVEDFVRRFVTVNQSQDVDAITSSYSDDVDYFGTRRDQVYIKDDVEKYIQRWPIRQDLIEGDIQVKEDGPEDYAATFKLNFDAEDHTGQWRKGQFTVHLRVNVTSGSPRISSIKEDVMQQQKGKGKVKQPAIANGSRVQVLQAARPAYPPEAEQRGEVGSGQFGIEFDERGNATAIEIVQSTGSKILDENTVSVLERWRAVAGRPGKLVVPITYTKPNHPAPSKQSATPAKRVPH